ncbi:MAG: hypothetical protein HQ522_23505 [Bacteroidetes bacterium]|nr:hypothetical protein [Bacteroidota bacterium]
MKKLSLLSALVVCLFVVSISANATGLRTEFSEYEVAVVEDLYVGNAKAIWTLSYSNQESPVTVVKRKTVEGTEYVVHSKFFEVSYASTAAGFGTKEVRRSWSNVPKKISKAVISQEEMKRQQIITPNKVDDEKAMGLIASYLPDLINDGYTHLLN